MTGNDSLIRYEYDAEADVLDIFFGETRRAWTIELTDNIVLGIDRTTQQPVSLTLLDFAVLTRPVSPGLQSFPLTGLDNLPAQERDLVARVLTTSPLSDFLHVSSVVLPAMAPLPITHLEPLPLLDLSHSRRGIFYPQPVRDRAYAVLREGPEK